VPVETTPTGSLPKSWKMASDSSDCFRYNFALVSRIANAFATSSSFDLKKGVTLDIDKVLRRKHGKK